MKSPVLKAVVSTVLLLNLLSIVVLAFQSGEEPDESKRFRASKKALSQLVHFAELRTGVTVLTFDIEPKIGCVTHYGSSVCPIPGKSRLEALKAAGRLEVEPEVERLQPVADFDGSGFVTDEEGLRFGVLVHFGQQLNYLVRRKGWKPDRLAVLMRLTSEELRSQLKDYKELIERAKRLNVSLVKAPAIR
jgi:hypothetical protein